MSARQRYRASLERLLDQFGVDASSTFAMTGDPIGRVHYLDTGGSGDPVVFLHGAGSSAADWVPLLPHVDRRCLVLERPGHGLSDQFDHSELAFRAFSRRLVAGFLDAVGVDAATFVGNSYGGWHALTYAAAAPDRVSRLVLLGAPFGTARDVPGIVRSLSLPVLNEFAYRMTVTDGVEAAREVYGRINVVDPAELPDCFFECHSASTHAPGRRETLLSLFESTVGLRGADPGLLLRPDAVEVECPTLFVWGDADYFHPPSAGRPVVQAVPDATSHELPDVGHMPWLEPGTETSEVVASFVG